MTSELEKQFFQCFGIKTRVITEPRYSLNSEYYEVTVEDYQQITDRILLELICILSEWKQYCISYYVIDAVNINTLKEDILRDCICMSHWYEFNKCGKDVKHQVRTLFEEG